MKKLVLGGLLITFIILLSSFNSIEKDNLMFNSNMTKRVIKERNQAWDKIFMDLIHIESNRLYSLNNNVPMPNLKIEDTFSLLPEYGIGYSEHGCINMKYFDLSYMYAEMLGCKSWSGYQSGCQEISSGGGGGGDDSGCDPTQDCDEW